MGTLRNTQLFMCVWRLQGRSNKLLSQREQNTQYGDWMRGYVRRQVVPMFRSANSEAIGHKFGQQMRAISKMSHKNFIYGIVVLPRCADKYFRPFPSETSLKRPTLDQMALRQDLGWLDSTLSDSLSHQSFDENYDGIWSSKM